MFTVYIIMSMCDLELTHSNSKTIILIIIIINY